MDTLYAPSVKDRLRMAPLSFMSMLNSSCNDQTSRKDSKPWLEPVIRISPVELVIMHSIL